jgi:cytochrome bd-type quinol oxidase subunit 2
LVLLLAAPAFVAVWSGWVGLGELTGFGVVRPLPGIADGFAINSAIALPIGVETYAAFALRVWLSGRVPARARRFAKWSAIGSLVLGAAGQVAYHLLVAAGVTSAPWQIITLVSCLPVAVLGMGAALAQSEQAPDTPRTDADLLAELRPVWDAFAPLSRYRVEQITGAGARQAQRLLDALAAERTGADRGGQVNGRERSTVRQLGE